MRKSSRFLHILVVAMGVLLVGGNSIRRAAPTLAADTGQIYVAAAHQIIRVNNITGAGRITLGAPGVAGANHFENPTGIFVDGAGRIYVADSSNDRIVRINDMTGAGWITLGAPTRFEQFNKPFISFNKPTGIFVDGVGRIYVADAGNGRIVRMNDMTGTGWTTLGTAGMEVKQFNNPDGVFVDEAGRIYVADLGNSRIVRINDMTGTGWTTLAISADRLNRFESPRAIFVDGTGQIYVMDLTRIVRVNDMTGTGWTTLKAPAVGSGIYVR